MGAKSSPNLADVDSAWAEEEELDEDATMVAKIPMDLVALSRRGQELEKKIEEPEKHEAITARPPPPGTEASVVVAPDPPVPEDLPDEEVDLEDEEAEEEEELSAEDLDAGWEVEEERAAAADEAAGLDADARRKAAEVRAAQRKEKARAKKIAAKEKRKAKADAIRQKQKKPKKRSTPPPPRNVVTRSSSPPGGEPKRDAAKGAARAEAAQGKAPRFTKAELAARRDLNRMVLFVALVVVMGAFAIGLVRR